MPEPQEPAPTDPSPAQYARVLWVLWLGMVQAGVVYALFAWFVPTAEVSLNRVVSYGVAVVSGLTSASSFALRPILLSPRRLARALETGGTVRALQAIIRGHVTTWILADSCAISGMVLGILGAPPISTFGPIVLGTALVIAQGPGAHTVPDLLAAAETEHLRSGSGPEL